MIEVKLPICSSARQLVHDDGAQSVEQLSGVELVLAIAANVSDHVVEIVEHDIFLRRTPAVRTVRLAHHLADRRC